MLRAKNRLLKAGAIAEFKDISEFVHGLSTILNASDSENLEGVLDDINVVIARLNDFYVDFKVLLK